MNIHDLFAQTDPSLPYEDRRKQLSKILKALPPQEFAQLRYHWSFWARSNQIAPLTTKSGMDWTFWLLLAGRGFGKTRTGAEWINEKVENGTARRIHLVAPTAADVRKVMVEGESGILAISPPWNTPIFEPSKLQLTWPNGAVAYMFSAEEPERLRGPQCLAGDTEVFTETGPVRIDQLLPGVRVWTRAGLKLVSARWLADRSRRVVEITVAGRSVRCTEEHLFITPDRGKVRASDLKEGDALCVASVLTTTESGSTEPAAGISKGPFATTVSCGTTSEALSPPNMMSTTKTTTTGTTTWRIWNFFPRAITPSITDRPSLGGRPGFAGPPRLSPLGKLRQRLMRPAKLVALFSRDSLPLALSNGIVQSGATVSPSGVKTSDTLVHVQSAARRLLRKCLLPSGALNVETETRCAPIERVRWLGRRVPVYDITVEGEHEFFANGVLSSNCDTFWADELAAWKNLQDTWDQLQFGFRLGRFPQGCITTTPKPLPIIKELMKNPDCAVTRGSTYDNRSNLAPQFFKTVITKYEGTRLGRQELQGDILEDMPGSLWKRSDIDSVRVQSDLRFTAALFAPVYSEDSTPSDRAAAVARARELAAKIVAAVPEDLSRVVVAVDPNVSNNEGSDEIGIVVSGKGISGRGYLLADLSMRGSPNEWAMVSILGHDCFRADRVIGEANQGGNLIEHTINTTAKFLKVSELRPSDNIAVVLVHATRGKVTRAEPVSSLYEQKRVTHIGTMPILEDQMCLFTSDFDRKAMGYSPDRVDALVWGFTHLFLEGSDTGILEFYQDAGLAQRASAAAVKDVLLMRTMLAPAGVSTVYGQSGTRYDVPEGGEFLVRAEDVKGVRAAGCQER